MSTTRSISSTARRRGYCIVPITQVLVSNNQLVQCFLVSGEVLSFIYAGVAVLSEDYSGLILPAVVAVMFLLFPQARQWIETSSESSES